MLLIYVFETTSGKYFTRTIKFVVVDNTGHTLKGL